MVKVKKVRASDATPLEQGNDIAVKDGHLFVFDAAQPHGAVVAAFAPGTWENVIVERGK